MEIQGTGYIDEVAIHQNPVKGHLEVLVRRKVAEVQQQLTHRQQLPAWELFAKVRQGGD